MATRAEAQQAKETPAPKVLTTEAFFKTMNKYGAGTVRSLADSTNAEIVHWTSTGLYALDDIMGWGLPGGRIVEFFGAESSGKTTQLMKSFIENARRGGKNIVFDPEGTFNQDRYKQMGGDPALLLIIDPGTAEEFYDKLKLTLKWARGQQVPTSACVLIGVDTMSMLIPQRVLEATGDDEPMAELPRVNSRHLPTVDKELPANTCLLLLSQIRDKVGAAAWGAADQNIDTPGGHVIKHLASVRVFFNKVGQLDNGKTKDDRVIIGMKTDAKVVKCKVGPPLRKCSYRILFDDRGVDNINSFLSVLVAKKLIKAPEKKVYTLIVGQGQEIKVHEDDFAELCSKRPKWSAKMLDAAFELGHPGLDVERFIGRTVPEQKEAE